MSKVTVAQEDHLLISALRENEFDIVGLAEFTPDQETLTRCLNTIHEVVVNDIPSNRLDECQLAHILLGMVSVAKEDYAANGGPKYWGFLEKRLGSVMPDDTSLFRDGNFLDGPEQSRLGNAFRAALLKFNYRAPDGGQVNIAPVLFHAGVPKSSMPGALNVIAQAYQRFGPEVFSLDSESRGSLIRTCTTSIHENVRQLFSSSLTGGDQLWSCLARVVYAWQCTGNCDTELMLLPTSMDPEWVRQCLPERLPAPSTTRMSRPTIRFDAETGEVRLIVPDGQKSDWIVRTGESEIDPYWTRNHAGATAEFRMPLPGTVVVQSRDPVGGETIKVQTMPKYWPGHWFHAHNGNIEPGNSIDANGIAPGRWYVLFEGEPTEWSVQPVRRVSLQWFWLAASSQWTAWEIEVPARTQECDKLECRVETNSFWVPLARRPSAQIEVLTDTASRATTNDGQALEVFATPPVVKFLTEKPFVVLLIEEKLDGTTLKETIQASPGQRIEIPAVAAGVYQLRQKGGTGRLLLRFAVVPQLEIEGPVVEAEEELDEEMACIRLKVAEGLGEFIADGDVISENVNGWHKHHFSTVSPAVAMEWRWRLDSIPVLRFRWPVEGVRWRLLGMTDDLANWTRETLLISPGKINSKEHILEIQFPPSLSAWENESEITARVQKSDSCNTVQLQLQSRKDRQDGIVEFRVGKTKYPAVIITERPSLESIEALTDLQNLVIEWSANESLAGCSLAVWNTADLFTPPQLIPLTQDQVKESVADLALETLPPGEVLGISIAREVRGFVKSFSIASLSTNPKQAAAVCLHRSTGEVYTAGDEPQFWPHLFFEMRVSSLFGRLLPKFWFMKRLRTLKGMGQSFPFQILEYMNSDTEFHRLDKFSKTWIPIVKNLFALIAKDSTSYERTCPMDDAHYKNFIELLERLGVARHSQHSSTIAPTDSQFPDGLRLEHQTGCVVSSKQDKYLLVFPKQGFDLQTAKEHYFSRDPNAGQLTFETAEFRFTDLTLVDQNLVQSAYKASQNKSSLTSLADMLIGCRFDFSAEFKNGWRACNLILRSGLPDAGNQRRKQPRRR